MAYGGDRKSEEAKSSGQNDHLKSASEGAARRRISEETGTSDSYVKRVSQFS